MTSYQFLLIAAIAILVFGIGISLLFWRFKRWLAQRLRPRSQSKIGVMYFGLDDAIRFLRMKIGKWCVQDDKTREGWGLLFQPQIAAARWTKTKDGINYTDLHKDVLPIDARDGVPIDFFGRLTKEDKEKYASTEKIALDAAIDINIGVIKEMNTQALTNMFIIVISLGFIAVITFVAINYFSGGSAV